MSEANAEDKAIADTPPAVTEEKEEIKKVEPAATGAATEEEAEMPAGETTSEEAAAGEATSEAATPAASEEEKKEDNNNNKQEEKSTDVDSSEVLKLEDAPIDEEEDVKPTTTESSGESTTTTTDADAAAAAEEEEEATPRNSAATTLTIASDAGPAPEEGMVHSFQPGDHVIRWEMLPILWPIQVHGIVLEVSNQCVTICDFGLTAEMRHDDDEQKVEETIDESNKKGNQRLQEAWDTVKPPDNRKKERITVHIMTTQEEIKPWKKVHYGRGLFGMGGDGKEGEGEDGEGGPSTPKKSAVMKQKVGNWFRGVKQGIQTRREARAEARRNNQLLQQKQQEAEAEAARIEITTTSNEGDAPPSPRTSNPTCLKGDFAAYDKEDQNGDGSKKENTEDAAKENGEGLTTAPSDPSLNTQATDNSTHSNTSDKDNNKPPAKEKNKLPESDPPKLVLARARLLLQQGEKILPPYHPFKSNSECIAVFCKTGYWRTLQASVFLHSTAIGNAKSSMAMTLGVAASMPLLAPAIALVGAGLVGAPYVILNQSKETWQQETLRLNEEFWKQAPNEVFVECIEHWSDLLKEEKEEKKKQEEAAAAEEEKKKQEEEAEKPSSQRLVSV